MTFNEMEHITFHLYVTSPVTAGYYHESSHGLWDLFSSGLEILSSLNAVAKINYFCYKVTAEFRRQFAFSKITLQKQVSKGPMEEMVIKAGESV